MSDTSIFKWSDSIQAEVDAFTGLANATQQDLINFIQDRNLDLFEAVATIECAAFYREVDNMDDSVDIDFDFEWDAQDLEEDILSSEV